MPQRRSSVGSASITVGLDDEIEPSECYAPQLAEETRHPILVVSIQAVPPWDVCEMCDEVLISVCSYVNFIYPL